MKLEVYISKSHNPYVNLSIEHYLENLDINDTKILYLWKNDKSIIIGKHQNPWEECNIKKMEEDSIYLVRRESGGGAVYHDLGNYIFTFLSKKELYDESANYKILTNALSHFKIAASQEGKNDIIVNFNGEKRKISGNAFKFSKNYIHHGTILLNVDMKNLDNYLTPNPKKLESKSISSIRSRVINLKEISNIREETLSNALIEEFEKFYGLKAIVKEIDLEELEKEDVFMRQYNKLSNWEWILGHTPKFSQKFAEFFPFGLFSFAVKVENGIIREIKVYTDYINAKFIDKLEESLLNLKYESKSIRSALLKLEDEFESEKKNNVIKDLIQLIEANID